HMRIIWLGMALALLLGAAATEAAAADSTAVATITIVNDDDAALGDGERARLLGAAACACGGEISIRVDIQTPPADKHTLKLFAGAPSCLTDDREDDCKDLGEIAGGDASTMVPASVVGVAWPADGSCQAKEQTRTLTVVDIDDKGAGTVAGTLELKAD